MTREESISISAEIATMISRGDLIIDYSDRDVQNARYDITSSRLRLYIKQGFLNDPDDSEEFEKFYIVKRLCDMLSLWERADTEYLRKLFSYARRFTVREFYSDPYLLNISVPNEQIGRFMLYGSSYTRGEIFQHEMPDLNADIIVPHIGFFNEEAVFPSIYEGIIPWVSVCPSEISSMKDQIASAHGNVLVLGLGLGYYPYLVSRSEKAEKITIIERCPEIIELFETHILPQFEHREKITVIHSDAYDYLESLHGGEYDFCFADIWEGQADGAPAYLKIKAHEKRLTGTEFTYWIEKQIISYIKHEGLVQE